MHSNYCLNSRPAFIKTLRKIGNVLFPNPCRAKISFSLNFDSCSIVEIPSRSNARLAGAETSERKLSLGLSSFSQTGQEGQSELL